MVKPVDALVSNSYAFMRFAQAGANCAISSMERNRSTFQIGAAMTAIVAEPDFRTRMQGMGGEAASGALATPEGFATFIAEDLARSRAAARAADIKPE